MTVLMEQVRTTSEMAMGNPLKMTMTASLLPMTNSENTFSNDKDNSEKKMLMKKYAKKEKER